MERKVAQDDGGGGIDGERGEERKGKESRAGGVKEDEGGGELESVNYFEFVAVQSV